MLAAQVANNRLLATSADTVQVNMNAMESRLTLQPSAFWVVEIVLVVLIIATISLCAFKQTTHLTSNPGSFTGLISVLHTHQSVDQDSANAQRALHNTSLKPESRLKGHLASAEFTTRGVASLGPVELRTKSSDAVRHDTLPDLPKWWLPWSLTLWGRLLIILCAILMIVILQVLQNISNHQSGLIQVSLT